MSGATSRRPDAGDRRGDPRPDPRHDREIEVKLEVLDRGAILALFDRHAGFEGLGFEADGGVAVRTVVDTYLDTADGRLRATGLAARLRREAGRDRVTVKSPANPRRHGVHDRLELEGDATAALTPADWPPSAARSLIEATIAGASLTVVASLRQERRTLTLRRGATTIELSLDDLEALEPRSHVGPDGPLATHEGVVLGRATELEAELLGGSEADLELLAIGLLRLDGLRPASGSKLDWARAAATAVDAATRRSSVGSSPRCGPSRRRSSTARGGSSPRTGSSGSVTG